LVNAEAIFEMAFDSSLLMLLIASLRDELALD